MNWVEKYIINNKTVKKIDWATEYYNIYSYYEGDFIKVVTELSLHNSIRNRYAVLMLGIFCEHSAGAYVNRWLRNLNMNRLTHRNQTDALFLYTYEAVKELSSEKDRRLAFKAYLKEYIEWSENNSFYAKGFVNNRKPESTMRLFPDVITVDDLQSRIALNSASTTTGTMKTIDTDKNAMRKLNEIIEQKGSISNFLDYLAFEEDAVRTYNIKASLYIEKIVYSMIKDAFDILAEHNLPDDENLKKQYIEAKDSCLLKTNNSKYAFKRFLKYNRCFIDLNTIEPGYDITKFRDWIIENKDKIKSHPEIIMEKTKNAKINYNALFTSFYSYLFGVKYGSIEKTVSNKGIAGYEELGIPYDSHRALFGKSDKQFDKAAIRFFVKAVGGNIFIDRTFLILCGMFARYGRDKLDHILVECDYLPLNDAASENSIDIAALDVFKYREDSKKLSVKNIVNTINFLNRTMDNTTEPLNKDDMIGTAERKLFEFANSELYEDFITYIENEDDDILKEIFDGSNSKEIKKNVQDISTEGLTKFNM